MKRLLLCMGLLVVTAAALSAQSVPKPGPPGGMGKGGMAPAGRPHRGKPLSPAAKASVTIAGKNIAIAYSSPRVRGREGKIFTKTGLISHDRTYPVWRAGANAATSFHTDANLNIAGLMVPRGNYTLYVDISNPAAWVLIINKQTGQWGLVYNKSQDLGRIKMTMAKPPSLVEDLKYTLTDLGGNKGRLTLAWENVSASVPFTVE